MSVCIGCVVEGHGECQALPSLIRRVAALHDPALFVPVPLPVRLSRPKMMNPQELERAVQLTLGKIKSKRGADQIVERGAVLVVLDGDDDCPAQLGPRLLQQIIPTCREVPCSVVLAHREFESWFLAAAESLAGHRGLAKGLQAPPNHETIRDAKGWLRERTGNSRKYNPVVDQAAFAACFDLALARERSRSFDKCYREIVRLLGGAGDPGGLTTEPIGD